ncbi:MAG TPA: DNA-formamidopyrimidine glycosylase family protein [Acidobacteriaceae bacterium]|nr:DNA-formamidopyrimidine glycosylase family protein [Acidobacteriaceae bacterium]
MPEGDTIYRAARALGHVLEGKLVTRFETTLAPLTSVDDDTPVAGRTVEKVESRGKWLLMHFSGDLILVTHMRMSGSWHIYRAGERWRRGRREMRVVVANTEFEAVAFNVPVAKFYTARTLARSSAIPKLGPDLLSTEFAADDAKVRLQAHGDEQIANVLLNQRVMAGLGNVYKSEVLFACGVHPFRLVSTLTAAEADCILDRGRHFLAANVKDSAGGGMVTYTGLRRTTRAADPGARLWVYRRQGKECRRCGTAILMRRQGLGARSTYWCPECQPELPWLL